MGKKTDYDLRKVEEIPSGMSYVRLTKELLFSPAWHGMSINCRRLIDFLLLEHMYHAGMENGNLIATYDQLVEFGIPRRLVHKTISEAEYLGLVLVERGGRKGCTNHLSKYTLTFLRSKVINEMGDRYYETPSNNWRRVKIEDVKKLKKKRKL